MNFLAYIFYVGCQPNSYLSVYPLLDLQRSKKHKAWHEKLQSRWLSFVGFLLSMVMMFLIHYVFAFIAILLAGMLYFYTYSVSPGTKPG